MMRITQNSVSVQFNKMLFVAVFFFFYYRINFTSVVLLSSSKGNFETADRGGPIGPVNIQYKNDKGFPT